MIHFAEPQVLAGCWGVILLGMFLFWGLAQRRKILARFVDKSLLPQIIPAFAPRRLMGKNILIIGGLFFAILSLARPQWGFEWQEVKHRGLDILIAVDTSKSMLAADVKPNRLERTKLAVKDLIKNLKGDRIGLLAFAGDAFMVCPLTSDYGGFMLSLDDLSVQTIARGGTNVSRAIDQAIRGYDQTPNQYKVVIIVTDGDNLEGDPLASAKKAKETGIKIYCIGIGTPEGELIQIVNDQGEKEFLKDNNGNFVKSRLNERLLQQIALTTDGRYVRSSGAEFGLDYIYAHELAKLPKHDIEAKMKKHYFDRFQIPLSIAFVLLLWETCLMPGRRKK